MEDRDRLRERVTRLLGLALEARADGQIGVSEMLIAAALRIDDEINKLKPRDDGASVNRVGPA